jgi:Uma2 family endonuclease
MSSATLALMETDDDTDVLHDTELDGWNYTVQEYYRIEQQSDGIKHEFEDGQIRAMSGGTLEHARLAMALGSQIAAQLRGKPCAVYSSDSRVRVAGLITYPDLSIGCGKTYMDLEDRYAQLNPCVLIEVTSRSSERYDRGKKRLRYFEIPSLRDYAIVSHRERAIDVYSRELGGAWSEPRRFGAGQIAHIPSADIKIDIDELYTNPRAQRD